MSARRIARAFPLVLLLAACAAKQPDGAASSGMTLLAVLPIENESFEAEGGLPAAESSVKLPAEAGANVTAQIYGVLADRPDLRFVPDLTVAGLMHTLEVKQAPNRLERARALGKQSKADAVLFGGVSRFRERVGSAYGATEPAAVTFDLNLLDMRSGEVVWHGRFEEAQEPLSSNLFKFWMFWQGGPYWFTAHELAHLGVEKLVGEMADHVEH